MNPIVEQKIETTLQREKADLLDEIKGLQDPTIFETLIDLSEAQKQEYDQLFDVPGHIPKSFNHTFSALFWALDKKSPFGGQLKDLTDAVELTRYISLQFNSAPLLFVRAVATESENNKPTYYYRFCVPTHEWIPQKGFSTDDGINFRASKIPVHSVITTTVDRLMLTRELFIQLLKEISNPDNWEIQEVDPLEHMEAQVFLWQKAYDKYFGGSENGGNSN